MKKEILLQTKGMTISSSMINDRDQLKFYTKIKRWFRKLEYKLIFNMDESLKNEFMKITFDNNWKLLEDNKIQRLENLAWSNLGFKRIYKLKEIPRIKKFKCSVKITLLGLEETEYREYSEISNIWIGTREGHEFALIHIGHYMTTGFSNMIGSSPITMVLPVNIVKEAFSMRFNEKREKQFL